MLTGSHTLWPLERGHRAANAMFQTPSRLHKPADECQGTGSEVLQAPLEQATSPCELFKKHWSRRQAPTTTLADKLQILLKSLKA